MNELAEISSELARLDLSHPYRVPTGYFEDLADRILLRIRAEETNSPKEELELISPFLSRLDKKMPFSTPEGYFDTLAKVPKEVKKEEGGRVISLFRSKTILRYAAAAVTIGVIVITAWLLMKPSETDNKYALNADTTVQKELKKNISELSENEIADFIEGGSTTFNYGDSATGADLNEDDVRLMLADISDQELEKYLGLENTQKEKFN